MRHYFSSKPNTNKLSTASYRGAVRFPIAHNPLEKQAVAQLPVEFKDDLLPSDTPRLVLGGVCVSPMNFSSAPITLQHEENVKFLSEEWERVRSDLNNSNLQRQRNRCVRYVERREFKNTDFKPFDLEEFWAKRLLEGVIETDHDASRSNKT